MTIPPLIHQTYATDRVPDDYRVAWAASWRESHPTWDYKLWTDADLLALARERYPDYAAALEDRTLAGVVRGDLGRLMVTFEFGGVYADLDYCSLRPLDALLADKRLVVSQMEDAGPWRFYRHQAFLAAVPGHEAIERVMRLGLGYYRGGRRGVTNLWGPGTFGKVFRHDAGPDLYLAPPEQLCPLSWMRYAHRELRELLPRCPVEAIRDAYPDAYALTCWAGSWKTIH